MIKSIKQQYIDLKEGKMTQHNFMRNVRMVLPQYITNVTSFKDSIKILKNKGILNECECDINNINLNEKNLDVDPKELQKGIEVEMEHTDDPVKAEQIALDHLAEDPQYYTKLATIEPEHSGDPSLKGSMAYLAKSLANPFPQYTKLKENAGIFNDLEQAKKEAQRMSDDEGGVAKHVDDNGDGTYSISDWYDADSTIASFGLGLDENDIKQQDNTIKKIDQSELSFLKKLYAKTPTEKIKKMIDDLEKTYKPLKEAKDEKGKWTNANGKSMYDQFKEIDNLNAQEVLIGLDWEMEKNANLNKREAAKIAIKKIKKIPNYYTMAYLSGEEGIEPQYLGGKSAEPEARQMKPYSADKVVDKKMGMQTVKGVNKVKSSANKAYKETNTIVKGVEELNFIAKKAAGIKQRFEPTSSTMKVVREGFKNNRKLNENVSFSEIKDLLTKISQENNLFIYNKETDLDGLKNAIKINKSIPKSGIIAVDSLTDTNYVFVVSKDKALNDKVNQAINQSEEFESHSGRTDDLDNGIVLTLLTVGKKQSISETIDQILTKERLKEVIRKELKNIKK